MWTEHILIASLRLPTSGAGLAGSGREDDEGGPQVKKSYKFVKSRILHIRNLLADFNLR